ncbi:MAG TPA: MFS transporter [Caulobacteraceae bacterium]|jgi:predicted MFS family arabinose efflux permease|nr:MFS transporter [Caulobacteraceae bacterium]
MPRDPRLATRLAFVVAGFVTACWAPLIPFAKARLGVNDAQLGLLLLCLGVGSLVGVSVAGLLAARIGARPVVIVAGVGLCALLPPLALAASPLALGLTLLLFGACLGALDVAMNAHGVQVEATAGAPLMSGFHALYSLGGAAGAGWMTLALRSHISPPVATSIAAVAALGLVAFGAFGLLATRPPAPSRLLVWPSGLVLLIAALTATMFLAEGSVFDWSALFILERGLTKPPEAGVGYILFSIAMTAGRISGDALVTRLGGRRVVQWGGLTAVVGLLFVLCCPIPAGAIGGFLLVGVGAANIVPVLFSAAGRQQDMPPALAVAAVTSTGYVGILAGPPTLGFVGHAVGLAGAFWVVTALLAFVPLLGGAAVRENG